MSASDHDYFSAVSHSGLNSTVTLFFLSPEEFSPSSNSGIQLAEQHSKQHRWPTSLDSDVHHSWKFFMYMINGCTYKTGLKFRQHARYVTQGYG